LLHLLLLYLLLLQASGNPLVFASKRDICAHVVACTTSRQPNHPSPSTHLKSPVACAIIWKKELDSLTLYKESNHHYRER
jgi:hypothetical protein